MYFYTLSQPNQTQERKLLARLEAWCKSAGCQLPHYNAMQISQTGFLLGRLNKQNNRDPKHLLWDKYTVRQLKILVWFFERIKGYVLLRLVEKQYILSTMPVLFKMVVLSIFSCPPGRLSHFVTNYLGT